MLATFGALLPYHLCLHTVNKAHPDVSICCDADDSYYKGLKPAAQISKAAVLGDANEVLKAIHKLKRRAYLCAASAPAVAGGARA